MDSENDCFITIKEFYLFLEDLKSFCKVNQISLNINILNETKENIYPILKYDISLKG